MISNVYTNICIWSPPIEEGGTIHMYVCMYIYICRFTIYIIFVNTYRILRHMLTKGNGKDG